jgi:hypothetical protein
MASWSFYKFLIMNHDFDRAGTQSGVQGQFSVKINSYFKYACTQFFEMGINFAGGGC